ncbi:hypothetical protein C477_04784 [Haloterrigena salina JCM 13891]|uniref:Uncharacterized protein n=1 Tax=Haloterrigena salina JCM 13891 TaxID=1227488 RepID=M0CF85_9EURY|nr:hypothetical protein [Haloterrigena salina]ELZ21926.1 hypothetical protein C477_04784 [Haloterrigena salina JCM 13891]
MIELALVPLQAGGEMPGMEYVLIGRIIALLIGLGVGYWVYKDASNRGNNELLWAIGVGALLALLFPIGVIALIAYIIIRGDVIEEESRTAETTGDDWGSADETTGDDW